MALGSPLAVVALAVFVAAVGAAGTQDLPAATEEHGGFGLLNESGSRLLVIPKLDRPELLKTALCSGGQRRAVQFEKRQIEKENNGRQSFYTFDKLGGSLFAVSGNKVDHDEACFLPSETLLSGATVWSLTTPAAKSACVRPERFAGQRGRKVTHCWPMARTAAGQEVNLIEFERRGTDALAALAVVDGARVVFVDFPATANDQSAWRVDDGGVMSPDGFKIMCVLQRGTGYVLGFGWGGAEGMLLQLWTADGSGRSAKVLNDYWYQAPT